jgi:hypothetical protein
MFDVFVMVVLTLGNGGNDGGGYGGCGRVFS